MSLAIWENGVPACSFEAETSINSDTESDPDVIDGQANYVYLRVWNRGADAANVFTTVYWSPPATLVTPNLWNLIGSAYYPDVPRGASCRCRTPVSPGRRINCQAPAMIVLSLPSETRKTLHLIPPTSQPSTIL
jgi:hypothetical protein